MGDLIGFEGFLNTSAPFRFEEYNAQWKSSRRYPDFDIGNGRIEECEYPQFWSEKGERIGRNVTDKLVGCRDGDFDQVSASPRPVRSSPSSKLPSLN